MIRGSRVPVPGSRFRNRCLILCVVCLAALVHAQQPSGSLPGQIARPAAAPAPAATAEQPKTGDPNKGTGVIRGHIMFADGRPARKASIQLTCDGPPRATAAADDGSYEFNDLAAGVAYTLSAGRAGYLVMEYGQTRAFEHGEPIELAEGETREKIDVVLQPNGAVSGRVTDEYGEPLENVTVRLLQLHTFANRREAVDVTLAGGQGTDDTGAYRIYGVPPGDYIVRASVTDRIVNSTLSGDGPVVRTLADLPGYAPTYYPGTINPGAAQVVRVGLSQDVQGIDIPLDAAPTARITGTAVDSQGRPLRVFMARSERSSGIWEPPVLSAFSDAGGFAFDNVPPGEYVLQTALGQRRGGESAEADFAMTYVTVDGRDVSDIQLAGTRGSNVAGTVVFEGLEADAKPPTVTITAWPVDADRSPMLPSDIASTRSGSDRRFQLSNLHGTRRLRVARAPQGWMLKAIVVNGQDVTDDVFPFGGAASQSLANVQVVLSKGATIVATALDSRGQPARDAVVAAYSTDADRWYVRSRFMAAGGRRKDGTFSVGPLPAGEYYVIALDSVVSGEGWNELQDPEFLNRMSLGAERVTIAEGGSANVTLRVTNR